MSLEITDSNDCLEYPQAIGDISSWLYMKKKDKELYCIGSKTVDRYLMIEKDKVDIIMEAVKYMDGQHSLNWINDYLKNEKKIDMDVHMLKKKLTGAGLIEGETASNVSSEISIMGVDLFNLKFPPVGQLLRKSVAVLWNIILVISFGVFLAAIFGIGFNNQRAGDFFSNVLLYKDSYVLGAFVAALFSIINIVIHETAHWSTAIKFGLQPSEFHMSLYAGIFPMWYVKIGGLYTVPTSKRIYIMGAGMYANAILMTSAIAAAMWIDLTPYQMQLISKLMISNMIQIIYCLSPFRLTDGYYILSLLTKVSNLRLRLLRAVGELFSGKGNRFDSSLIVYMLVSLAIMGGGTYTTLNWNFKVFYELSNDVNNTILKYLVISIPFIVTAVTLLIFLRQFLKFIKKIKAEEMNNSNQ